VNPDYVIHRDAERVVLRNYEGKTFEYPEPTMPVAAPLEPAASLS
jgi:lysine 2,3-aminomutase